MSCCSNRRAALGFSPPLRAAALVAPAQRNRETETRLRYLGHEPLTLRGPVSGRVYNVNASAPELAADPRDVEALLRTQLFEA